MKRIIVLAAVIGISLVGANGAWAGEAVDPVEQVLEACEPEIEAYCSQVTPGEKRLLACFYAHEDKLSGRCGYALYDAAAQLEQFAVAVAYLAQQCHDDLMKFCAEVKVGEGRVGSCLLEHQEEVTESCRQAMEDGELHHIEE